MNTGFLAGTRFRLFVLVFLTILPVTALLYHNAMEQRRQAASEMENNAWQLVRLIAVRQQQELSEERELLTNITRAPEIRDPNNVDFCSGYFSQVLVYSSKYLNFALVNSSGEVICSAHPTSENVNLADRPWFRRPMEQRGFSMGEFTIGRITGVPALVLAHPVMDINREIISVATLSINLSFFLEFPGKENLPAGSEVTVFDRMGTVLAHTPDFNRWVGREAAQFPIAREVLARQQGITWFTGADGVQRLYAFMSIFVEPADVPDAFVAVGLPTEEAFAEINRNLTRNMLILAGVAILTLLAAWWGGNQLLLRHLNALVVAARRLASGDLSARMRLRQGQGELTVLAGAFDDMAEALERREAELRSSEQHYRTIFENTGTAMMLVEEDTTISLVNSRFEELGGLSREEIQGKKSWTEWVLPEELAKLRDYHQKRRLDPSSVPSVYETRYRHLSGEVRDALIFAALIPGTHSSVLSVMDITERKRAEADLRRLTMAIEQAAESIVITDLDGIIQYVNPAFERITGYSRAEAIGVNPRILASGQHDKAFYEQLWATLRRGEVWSGHFVNKRKDGTLYQEDATISPVRDASGTVTHYVAVKRDVTHEIEMENQLRQAQKMEALGTLAGGIAHDFNNILGAILGYTELTLLDLASDSTGAENLRTVIKSSHRARDLVKQILAFSRMSGQEHRPLQLGHLFKEALRLLRASIPTTIIIEPVIDLHQPEGDMVMADPTQIHQVLMNLCTNAVQAMRPHGGVLKVGLASVDFTPDDPNRPNELSAGPYVHIWVADTGQGIEPEILERIFDPFFTTKGVGEGTGMGLAVVHGIVQGHHGIIRVESQPGMGTTFNVWFPRLLATADQEDADLEVIAMGDERILLVDDEPSLLDAGCKILQRFGYGVAAYTSAIEALEAFKAAPDRYDLVFTDQTMPGMTGAELAQQVLLLRPGMPIIMCTGFSETIDAKSAQQIGIRDLLTKPLVMGEVASVVRRVLDANGSDSAQENTT
jgi:PAS domain S-box-containing protein